MDERMAMELAATQHSLITHDQARRAGLSRRSDPVPARQGSPRPVHQGVYRFASAPESREQRLLAACLAVGHDLSGLASVGRRRARDLVDARRPGSRSRSAGTGRRSSPGVDDASPRRSLGTLDRRRSTEFRSRRRRERSSTSGAVLPLGSVSRALDRAIGRRLATLAEVRAAMDAVARKGRAGVGVMRRLLAERGDAPATAPCSRRA